MDFTSTGKGQGGFVIDTGPCVLGPTHVRVRRSREMDSGIPILLEDVGATLEVRIETYYYSCCPHSK